MSSPGRIVGIAIGALAILAIGVYGPATLLGPLPAVAVASLDVSGSAEGEAAEIPLPEEGASAVALVPEPGAEPVVLASAGDEEPVAIGGVAKLVTLLVTVDAQPISAGDAGASLKIGPDDYRDYLRYQKEGSRTLTVSPGDTWTQRDVLRAVLLASSNNHADTLVRWAFGSPKAYVTAAGEWLAEHGFEHTSVDDATGLSGDNVGTASEAARLAAMLLATPALAEILDEAGVRGDDGRRNVPDVIAHQAGSGIRSMSRSFTDQAGLCFIFTGTLDTDAAEGTGRIVGAMLRMPDYETLDPAVDAVIEAVDTAAAPRTVIEQGTAYASAVSPWGDRARLVATLDRSAPAFSGGIGESSVSIESFATAKRGAQLGRVSVEYEGGTASSPLELDGDIRDPGPLWRLANPVAMIEAYFAAQEQRAAE